MSQPAESARATTPPGWKRRGWRMIRMGVLVYVGVLLVLMFFENSLVYQPATAAQDWQPPPVPEIEDVELTTTSGVALHGWWCPKPGATSALLYFHGNAGNLSHRGGSLVKIRELLGVSVFIIDYPGYGKSAGRPSEAGCCEAGDAAYAWLTQRQKIAPDQILLWGASLGGGIAVDIASRKDCRALILLMTFTSMPDVAAFHYPWAPVRWIMRNRYPNLDKLATIRRPVFITHGTSDEVVPFAHGERLFQAANEPKRFYPLDKLGHNEPLPRDLFEALKLFLDEHAPASARG